MLVVVLHYIAFQELFKAVQNQFAYGRFIEVFDQEWRETCQETIWKRLAIYPVDKFGRRQVVLLQELFFKSRSHLILKDIAYQQLTQNRSTAFVTQNKS